MWFATEEATSINTISRPWQRQRREGPTLHGRPRRTVPGQRGGLDLWAEVVELVAVVGLEVPAEVVAEAVEKVVASERDPRDLRDVGERSRRMRESPVRPKNKRKVMKKMATIRRVMRATTSTARRNTAKKSTKPKKKKKKKKKKRPSSSRTVEPTKLYVSTLRMKPNMSSTSTRCTRRLARRFQAVQCERWT